MPTGFTDAIYKGIEFEDFVLSCSRNFGALMHMRDESSKTQITLPECSDYHAKGLEKAQKKLVDLHSMSEIRKKEGSRKDYEKADAYQKRMTGVRAEQEAQLMEMLEKVEAWQPPTTDHVGLSEFMIKQIKTTIDHDCRGFEKYETPVVQTPEEWFEHQIKSAERDVAYHEKHIKEDYERNEKRRSWIVDLFESIGRGEQVKTLKNVTF